MSGEHPHLFPRSRRLTGDDFAAVIHAGRVLRGRGFAILQKTTDVAGTRFGIVVPKRYVPSAVNRNYSKRILREWFRHNGLRLLTGDCVIRITAPMKGRVDRGNLIAKIERLLSTNPSQ